MEPTDKAKPQTKNTVMTKQQDIRSRELVELVTEVKNRRGQYAIDFCPNGYSTLEAIVLKWEKGGHTAGEFRAYKQDMLALHAALQADPLEMLQLETWDKNTSSMWLVGLATYSGSDYDDTHLKARHLDEGIYKLLDNSAFFTRLLIENKGILEADEALDTDSALPKLSRVGMKGRYGSIDNLERVMSLCGYSQSYATSILQAENDLLKIRTFRKEA